MNKLTEEMNKKVLEVIELLMDGDPMPETLQGKALSALAKWKEQMEWLDTQDWDNAEQFHGEDSNGNCALCHGDEEQCAFCKAQTQ